MSKRRRPGAVSSRAKPARERIRDVYVARPFAGLADEPEWVALRELVPAATAPLRLSEKARAEHGERDITLATVLPLAWPGLVKPDGRILLGLQRSTQSGDVSRDLALTLLLAFNTEPGGPVSIPPLPGLGPRLQDLLCDDALAVTIRDGFDFWIDDEASTPDVRASLERANASVFPTARLAAAPGAYWCRFTEKAHVRWVLGDDEDLALAALSRLSHAGELTLGPQTRFAGMFRAHGLLVPVWDLPTGPEPDAWEEPVAALAVRYATARDAGIELDAEQRRARAGLLGRQVSLR
ncbi:MAG TPA: DUF5926 family protein [Micromonosporaceae bacterium]|jgi:hypothetical protein